MMQWSEYDAANSFLDDYLKNFEIVCEKIEFLLLPYAWIFTESENEKNVASFLEIKLENEQNEGAFK